MKKAFLITLLLFLGKSYAQDSIVNYLDFRGNVTKKSKSFSVETIVKKSGFWQYTAYYRNGKIKEKGQYNNKRKEIEQMVAEAEESKTIHDIDQLIAFHPRCKTHLCLLTLIETDCSVQAEQVRRDQCHHLLAGSLSFQWYLHAETMTNQAKTPDMH